MNLGLRDAMVLAQEIVDAKRFKEDWGDLDVLNRYMKQRLPDVLSILGSMGGFHQLFTHNWPGLPELRGLGMRLVGNSGPIKQLLITPILFKGFSSARFAGALLPCND